MIDRISNDLKFYQEALALRQQRQEIISGNIANADTSEAVHSYEAGNSRNSYHCAVKTYFDLRKFNSAYL